MVAKYRKKCVDYFLHFDIGTKIQQNTKYRLTRNQFFLGVMISFPKISSVAGTPI